MQAVDKTNSACLFSNNHLKKYIVPYENGMHVCCYEQNESDSFVALFVTFGEIYYIMSTVKTSFSILNGDATEQFNYVITTVKYSSKRLRQ